MKNKDRFQLNLMLEKEDLEVTKTLKEKYGLNISGTVKLLLKQYLKQLEKAHVNINLQDKT